MTGPCSSLEDETQKGHLLKMSKGLWKVKGIVSPGVEQGLSERKQGRGRQEGDKVTQEREQHGEA